MRKCLVTGAAGFIGSALVQRLLKEGVEVLGVDILPLHQAANLKQVIGLKNFKYASTDVSANPEWTEMTSDSSEIYLLASVVGVRRVILNPEQTIRTALSQIQALGNLDLKGKTVFFASTSEVYGKTNPPFVSQESDDLILGSPAKPRWSYACSKLLSEHLLIALANSKGFSLKIGRLFNIVGPGQNLAYGAVVPNFVSQAIAGKPILVYGDGSQTRSFCHVSDAVEAIIALVRSEESPYEVFNIGSPSPITILDLAKEVRGYFGNTSNIEFEPYCKVMPDGFEEIAHRAPAVEKIQKHTGWQCRLSLVDIIRDTEFHLKQAFSEKG